MQRVFATLDALMHFLKNLRKVVCPRCHAHGTLVRHGYLRGWIHPGDYGVRGWRIYCDPHSPHGKGCGHAPSLRLATTLVRRCFDSTQFTAFLTSVHSGNSIGAAWKYSGISLHLSAAYRLYKRLQLCQSILRPHLSSRAPPPAPDPAASMLQETITHLYAAFPGCDPVSAYQTCFQIDFLSLV